ncbi:hypothetical protein [Ekhidna sp.]|uniref:hypothetical protein n=1 Tax=Ekhidna sp. TaxID=2608089 RepID=UPI00329A020D
MKKYLLISLLSLITVFSFGQMGSIGFSLGLPQNEFKENTDATGFGGDLSFAFPFQKGTPIYLGLDVNYMIYGRNAQNEDLFASINDQNGNELARLEIPLRIVNTNSIFGTHAFIRAVAPLELIQPYGEALFGFRYISTNTKILDRSNDRRWATEDDSDVISRETVLDDWILSYGFGGGFLIKIGPKAFIDLRVNYFKGQRAEYFDGQDTESWEVTFSGSNFDEATVSGDDLTFNTSPRESTTDLLVIKFGVAFKI